MGAFSALDCQTLYLLQLSIIKPDVYNKVGFNEMNKKMANSLTGFTPTGALLCMYGTIKYGKVEDRDGRSFGIWESKYLHVLEKHPLQRTLNIFLRDFFVHKRLPTSTVSPLLYLSSIQGSNATV